MKKKVFSKSMSWILSVVMIFGVLLIGNYLEVQVEAAGNITTQDIQRVLDKYGYVTGSYWTTYDYPGTYSDCAKTCQTINSELYASSNPATSSSSQSWKSWNYNNAWQCHGFALYVMSKVTGTTVSGNGGTNWTKITTQPSYLQVGDIFKTSGHTAVVLTADNGRYTFAECWGSVQSKISIGKGFNYYYYTIADITAHETFQYVLRYGGNIPSDTTPPVISNARTENVSGSSFTIKCDLSDNVGVTRVWLNIYGPGGSNGYGLEASNGSFSHTISTSDYGGAGYYTVHIYAFDAEGNETPCAINEIKALSTSEPVDIGTHFFATIKNTEYKNYISKVNNNNELYLQDKDNSSKQIWYFERQSDGAYVITSSYDDTVLEMTNGERGNSKHVSAQVSFSGETYQQWYIISAENGYKLVNRYCSDAGWYLDRSSYGDENGNYVQIYEEYYDSSDQVWTIDKNDIFSNIGERFYAAISSAKYGKAVSKVDGTNEIYLKDKNDTSKQIWYFDRQSDGSYVITSCYDETVLEMTDGVKGDAEHISAKESYSDKTYQKWYLIPGGYGYRLVNKFCMDEGWYFDRSSFGDDNGNYIQVYQKYYDSSDQVWSIDTVGAIADLGEHFYCSISNTKYGKAVSKIDGTNEIYLQDKNKTSKQIWYFDRQTDGAYVITSCYDETVLEMTNGEKGNYKRISAHDNFSGESYQQWYMIASGDGYRIINKYCINECWYFDRSSNGNSNGNFIQIHEKYYDPSDQIWTIDKAGAIADLGEKFYSRITNTRYGGDVTKINGTNYVYLQNENSDAEQVWLFEKQSDGAYSISSCSDGKAIEMTNGVREDGKQISAYQNYNGVSYQQWYLIPSGKGYKILNKHYMNEGWYLDRSSRSDNNGIIIQIFEKYSKAEDQIWTIAKTNKPLEPIVNTTTIAAEDVKLGGYITINASATGGTGGYTYAVWYKRSSDSSWTTKQNYSTNATIKIKPASAEKYDISVKVKDSSGTIVKKAFTVNVFAPLKNTTTVSSTSIGYGGTFTVKAKATGGLGDYTYAVYYKKASATKWTTAQNYSSTKTVTIKPKYAEEYDVSVKVKDSRGVVAKKTFKIKVTKPTNTSKVASTTITLGNTIDITCSATGGSGFYQYAVYYKKSSDTSWKTKQSYSSNTNVSIKPASKTKYDVSVKVKDGLGNVSKKAFTITVK